MSQKKKYYVTDFWSYCYRQDSIDQCQMSINANQYRSKLHHWSQCRSIQIWRSINVWILIGIDRHWTLTVDRGSSVQMTCSLPVISSYLRVLPYVLYCRVTGDYLVMTLPMLLVSTSRQELSVILQAMSGTIGSTDNQYKALNFGLKINSVLDKTNPLNSLMLWLKNYFLHFRVWQLQILWGPIYNARYV